MDLSVLIVVVQTVCELELHFGHGEGFTFELMSINKFGSTFENDFYHLTYMFPREFLLILGAVILTATSVRKMENRYSRFTFG